MNMPTPQPVTDALSVFIMPLLKYDYVKVIR